VKPEADTGRSGESSAVSMIDLATRSDT